MKIVVNGFTYDSGKFSVAVGDTVLLPYPSWHPDAGRGSGLEGVVESIGSDYKGYLRPILGILKRAKQVALPVNPPVPPMPPAKVPAQVTKNRVVTVKEIEQLVREAEFIVIENRAFRYYGGSWQELS